MACGRQKVKGGHGSITASISTSIIASIIASVIASIITLNLGVGCAPSCWPIFGFRNLLGGSQGRRGQFSVQSDNRFSGRGGGVGSLPRAWRRVGMPGAMHERKNKNPRILVSILACHSHCRDRRPAVHFAFLSTMKVR